MIDEQPFLWGVATSAYQAEGGYNGPGQPRTNWAPAEEKGDVANTGAAADFWRQYREDFERCRSLGLNAFRLGIEWSRVQPHPPGRIEARRSMTELPPGVTSLPSEADRRMANIFDHVALDHYVDILTACRENGLEPVVTLHHFVHPE